MTARGGGKVAGASHGRERDGMCCLWEAQNVRSDGIKEGRSYVVPLKYMARILL